MDVISNEPGISNQPILVVDDDEQSLQLYRYKLEEEGYQVLEASSGLQAIDIYQAKKPQLILMDAVMPEMDGFEACREILSMDDDAKPLILIITALDDDKSVDKAFAAGATDFITKPVSWSVLIKRVGYLFQASSAEYYKNQVEEQRRYAHKMSAITQMTSGIAHDFNNLLAGIMGYAELANQLASDGSSKEKKYIHQIIQSGKRAQSLIQTMLLSAQQQKGSPEKNEADTVINNALELLEDKLPSTVTIVKNFSNNIPLVLMDVSHIYQAIINLCINAQQAMDDKGIITISLNTASMSEEVCSSCHQPFSGEYLKISIADTGVGIEQDNLDKLFDPFFTTRPAASGLGLSLVHGVIHKHNGHIIVDSQPGKGSTFHLYLPIT